MAGYSQLAMYDSGRERQQLLHLRHPRALRECRFRTVSGRSRTEPWLTHTGSSAFCLECLEEKPVIHNQQNRFGFELVTLSDDD
jgi:hypothetical protein